MNEIHLEQNHRDCHNIERLSYLKSDELSTDESNTLQKHLENCDNCRAKYQEIQLLIQQLAFKKSSIINPDVKNNIEDRVLQQISGIRKKSESKTIIYLKSAFAAASVLFFFFFSAEQINTISKITKLEDRLEKENQSIESTFRKGDLLINNHFFCWEEIASAIPIDLDSEKLDKKILSKFLNKNSLSLRNLSLVEQKQIIGNLLAQTNLKIPMLLGIETFQTYYAIPD